MWEDVGRCGDRWGGIVPLFTQEQRNKKNIDQKTRHKLPRIHKVGAVVSPYLKTPKPTYQIRYAEPPYVRDCVSVYVRVRVYMYIIP